MAEDAACPRGEVDDAAADAEAEAEREARALCHRLEHEVWRPSITKRTTAVEMLEILRAFLAENSGDDRQRELLKRALNMSVRPGFEKTLLGKYTHMISSLRALGKTEAECDLYMPVLRELLDAGADPMAWELRPHFPGCTRHPAVHYIFSFSVAMMRLILDHTNDYSSLQPMLHRWEYVYLLSDAQVEVLWERGVLPVEFVPSEVDPDDPVGHLPFFESEAEQRAYDAGKERREAGARRRRVILFGPEYADR